MGRLGVASPGRRGRARGWTPRWKFLSRIDHKRLIVTHMGPDVPCRPGDLPCEHAEDAKRFTVM